MPPTAQKTLPGLRASRALFAAGLLLAVSVHPAAATAPPFEAPGRALDVGGPAKGVGIADLDGDGRRDVVTYKDEVEVQFGVPNGGLGPVSSITLDGVPIFGLLADLDGDTRPEIVTGHNGTSGPFTPEMLHVWRCRPDRTLEHVVQLDPDPSRRFGGLAAGDFDDDGDLDLAADQSDGVLVLRNDGAWTFGRVLLAVGPGSSTSSLLRTLVAADFDGDGGTDLGRTDGLGGRVILFTGPGLAYMTRTTEAGAIHGRAIGAADLDGDGRDEMLISPATGDAILIWESTPTALVARGTIVTGGDLRCVGGGDMDGDGLDDVVAGDASGRELLWYRSLGGFTYGSRLARAAGGVPTELTWSDIDGDGRVDPVVASSSGLAVVAYPSGPALAADVGDVATGAQPAALRVGNFDGDGHRDFAVLAPGSSVLSVHQGEPGDSTWSRTDLPIDGAARDLQVVDVDGDGTSDVVTLHGTNPPLAVVRRGDGAGGFDPPLVLPVPGGSSAVRAADLDLDGNLDLLVVSANLGLARPYRGDGNAGFVAAPDVAVSVGTTDVLLHDVTQDGRPDLVLLQAANSAFTVRPGAGAGIDFAAASPRAVPGGLSGLEILDADGNGVLDLAFARSDSDGPALVLGLGGGDFGPVLDIAAGPSPGGIRAGSIDGDAHMDLVVLGAVSATTGTAGCVHALHGRGDGTFEPAVAYLTGLGPGDLALADVTADGRPDVLVSQRVTSTVRILINRSLGTVGVEPAPLAIGPRLRVVATPGRGPFGLEFAGRPHVPVHVRVFTVAGRPVGATRVATPGPDGRVGLTLPRAGRAGIYLVRAEQGGRSTVARAVELD